MKEAETKLDFGLVLVVLRALLGWNRATLAQKSGVDEGLLADYERGLSRPIRKTRERLAKAFEVEVSFLDGLVPLCRGTRLAYESARQGGRAAAPAAAALAERLEGKIADSVLKALEPFVLELAQLDSHPN